MDETQAPPTPSKERDPSEDPPPEATRSEESAAAPEPSSAPHGFFLALAVLAIALGIGEARYRRSKLPKAIVASDTYQTKVGDYTRLGGADVVLVGSSRIYHGAHVPLLEELTSRSLGKPISAYNFGVPAGDLPGYRLIVEDVLRPGLKKPTLFVFGMSPIEWTCCPATSVPSSAKWITGIRPRHGFELFSSASDPEEAFTDLTVSLFQSYGARTYVLNELLRDTPPQGVANAGNHGWVSFGWSVDAQTQNVRATGRAEAYRPNFYPPKHFDLRGSHRYLTTALDRLESAGVKVAIIGTPQARQLDRNNDATSYYPEYVEYMKKTAEAHGTAFVNFNDFSGLTNADFADGDHLLEPGARKFTQLLSTRVVEPALKGERPSPLP